MASPLEENTRFTGSNKLAKDRFKYDRSNGDKAARNISPPLLLSLGSGEGRGRG